MREEFIKTSFESVHKSRRTPKKAAAYHYPVIIGFIADYEKKARSEFASDLYEVLKQLHARRMPTFARGFTERVLGRFWHAYRTSDSYGRITKKQAVDVLSEIWKPAVEEDNAAVLESLLSGPQVPMANAGIVAAIVKKQAIYCAEVMSRRWKLQIPIEHLLDMRTAIELKADETARIIQLLMHIKTGCAWGEIIKCMISNDQGDVPFGWYAIDCMCETGDYYYKLLETSLDHNVDLEVSIRSYHCLRKVMSPAEAIETVCEAVPTIKAKCRPGM